MRRLLLLVMIIFTVACKQGAEDSSTSLSGKPIITVGQIELINMELGVYVKGGSAHPSLWGDVIEIDGSSYKYAHWVNGEVVIEEGTVSYRQTMDVIVGELSDTHTYTNYIEFHPQTYTPNNCGYNFDSYEKLYTYTVSGSINTQHVDLNSDMFTMAFSWPLTVDWATNNLTHKCL